MLLLNIGLERQGKPNSKAQDVVNELFTAGFIVEAHTVQQSDTEPPVVALVRPPKFMVDERINSISSTLMQECIAVYDTVSAQGRLVGPKAAKWGEFNADYFFLLNGDRLGNNPMQAAA